MKQFLKPNAKKIFLFLVLATLTSLFPISLGVTDVRNNMAIQTNRHGLPLPFYLRDFNDAEVFQGSEFFSYTWMAIDLLV